MDVLAGFDSSYPSNLTAVDGELYFTAYNGSGAGIWKSDGTAKGTVLAGDFLSAGPIAVVNGDVFFSASDSLHGQELWVIRASETIDTVLPSVTIAEPTPNPRQTSVESIEIVFSEAVRNVDLTDFVLTRGGQSDLLPAASRLTSSDNVHWTLSGLTSITADSGIYNLTWSATSDITDLAGNAVSNSPSVRWITRPGDSNNDGKFNSSDLVKVFVANEYEDVIVGNSTFEEGDWNGDGDFDSSDLVYVFQLRTYVAAAKPGGAIGAAVIQPASAHHAGRQQMPFNVKRIDQDAARQRIALFDANKVDRVFDQFVAPSVQVPRSGRTEFVTM
jgi:ELWxxDGT repeat protein